MAGMHRDKCGAAAVAGFFQVRLSQRCQFAVRILDLCSLHPVPTRVSTHRFLPS